MYFDLLYPLGVIMAFDIKDYHEGVISFDHFKELLQKMEFKIDTNKFSIESIHSLSSGEIFRLAEKTIKYNKKETYIPSTNMSKKEKLDMQNELEFYSGIKLIILRNIIKFYFDIAIRTEGQLALDEVYSDYLKSSNEKTNRDQIASQILLSKQIKSMQEQNALLNDHINTGRDRLNNFREQARIVNENIANLLQQRIDILNQHSNIISNDLMDIVGNDGKPVFDKFTKQEKEMFAKEFIPAIANIKMELRNKNELLDNEYEQLQVEIKELDSHIREKREASTIKKGEGNIVAFGFQGLQDSNDFMAQRKKKVDRCQEIDQEKLANIAQSEQQISNQTKVAVQNVNPDRLDVFEKIAASELETAIQQKSSVQLALQSAESFDYAIRAEKQKLHEIYDAAKADSDSNKTLLQDEEILGLDSIDDLMELDDELGDFLQIEQDLDIAPAKTSQKSKRI